MHNFKFNEYSKVASQKGDKTNVQEKETKCNQQNVYISLETDSISITESKARIKISSPILKPTTPYLLKSYLKSVQVSSGGILRRRSDRFPPAACLATFSI